MTARFPLAVEPINTRQRTMDLILSSGFLAFARHIGILKALEGEGLPIEGVCGTSSGALVGSMWAAGHSPAAIAAELSSARPLSRVSVSFAPWRGLLGLGRVVKRLRELLPATFEELERPFACGVQDLEGRHRLLAQGPLPEAVAASCAIPRLFRAVRVGDVSYSDGGMVDRLGLSAWRQWRPERRAVVHWVERTSGNDLPYDFDGLTVVRTPASGASLLNLGDFHGQLEEAYRIASSSLATPAQRATG